MSDYQTWASVRAERHGHDIGVVCRACRRDRRRVLRGTAVMWRRQAENGGAYLFPAVWPVFALVGGASAAVITGSPETATFTAVCWVIGFWLGDLLRWAWGRYR